MEKKHKIALGVIIPILLIATGSLVYNNDIQFNEQIDKQNVCGNFSNDFLVYVTGLDEMPNDFSNYTILEGECNGWQTGAGVKNLGENNSGPFEIHINGPDVESLKVQENRATNVRLENGNVEIDWITSNFTAVRV